MDFRLEDSNPTLIAIKLQCQEPSMKATTILEDVCALLFQQVSIQIELTTYIVIRCDPKARHSIV